MTRARPIWLVLVGVVCLLLAGCTGIPRSSRPEQVQSIGVDEGNNEPPITPTENADPRTIVSEFLSANGTSDPSANGALGFLTKGAKGQWDPSTVTVISDPRVGVFNSTNDTLPVLGAQIGTIDANGVYSLAQAQPALTFQMARVGGVDGQWRIDKLPKGLLISESQFDAYHQRSIYFFDAAEQELVPEPRWTTAVDQGPPDRNPLAAWLVAGLFAAPAGPSQTAEVNELPHGLTPNAKTITVQQTNSGTITRIEIPGASALSTTSRDKLAAQVAQTLDQVSSVAAMEITDGGVPVSIPNAGGATFGADTVSAQYLPAPPPVGLYYICRGTSVCDSSGEPIPGAAGKGVYGLETVAIAQRGPNTGSGLLVAGTRSQNRALDIGTAAGKLVLSKLPAGPLSRPDWAPGMSEVWIGDGSSLYRVQLNGVATAVNVTGPGIKALGQVIAVRLSPEGSRVALVLKDPTEHTGAIWVGAVSRSGGVARVGSLTQISPANIDVTDVAWNDSLKLFAVGRDTTSLIAGIYEVQVDGSLWTVHGIVNLPEQPDSITASQGRVAFVGSGGSVWMQDAGAWSNLPGTDGRGSFPVYST